MNNQGKFLINKDIKYEDLSVLTTDTPELSFVNYYFKSISNDNEEVEKLLYQIIGASLYTEKPFGKAFILKGIGRNSKSTYVRLIELLAGPANCSHEHLEKLSGNKSGSKSTVSFLRGCVVNVADDQRQPSYVDTSMLCRLITGNTISIGKKWRDDMIPKITLIFTVNDVIDFKDTGLYIRDRFYVIPFSRVFIEDTNRIIDIEKQLATKLSLQIIATRAVKEFKEVLERKKFTIPSIVEQETEGYFMSCNNIIEFCATYPIKRLITKTKYYEEYFNWCKDNNLDAYNNVKFGKEVKALGYRSERYTICSKRNNYYVVNDFDKSECKGIYETYLKRINVDEWTASKVSEDAFVKENEEAGAISFSDYLAEILYDDNIPTSRM